MVASGADQDGLRAPAGGRQPVVRVVIADDSFLIREGLARMLAASVRVQVIAQYADAGSLMHGIDGDRPDVVVTDIRMPPTRTDEGMQLAEWLRQRHPRIGVVIISQYANEAFAAQLLASGAAGRGYLLKDRISDVDHLVETICAVADGDCRVDVQLIEALMSRRRGRSRLDELTPRQREILADVATGYSNASIARRLSLSMRAVEKHVGEIFGRLGLVDDDVYSRRVRAALLFLGEQSK